MDRIPPEMVVACLSELADDPASLFAASLACRRMRRAACVVALRAGAAKPTLASSLLLEMAAAAGHTNLLMWGRANGCPWSAQVAGAAASGGQVDILIRLLAHHRVYAVARGQTRRLVSVGLSQPYPWVPGVVIRNAAKHGRRNVLEWLVGLGHHDSGWPWTQECVLVCERAAANGHINVLAWARQQVPQCPWGPRVCAAAAANGRLSVLEWLRKQTPPCPWDTSAGYAAARRGDLTTLKWLRLSQGDDPPAPWDEGTCACAASGGHLEVLKWLRSPHGDHPPCSWGPDVCSAAAAGGHLEVLRWLRMSHNNEPPCPWDRYACDDAAEHGHLEVLQWLRADGTSEPPCPWGVVTCTLAVHNNRFEILRWLRSQEPPCPWDLEECYAVASVEGDAVLRELSGE